MSYAKNPAWTGSHVASFVWRRHASRQQKCCAGRVLRWLKVSLPFLFPLESTFYVVHTDRGPFEKRKERTKRDDDNDVQQQLITATLTIVRARIIAEQKGWRNKGRPADNDDDIKQRYFFLSGFWIKRHPIPLSLIQSYELVRKSKRRKQGCWPRHPTQQSVIGEGPSSS